MGGSGQSWTCWITFDQVGFATRILEGGTTFYARHGGRASLFGHMVRDVHAVLDVVQCLGNQSIRSSAWCANGETPTSTYPAQSYLRNIPYIDVDCIYLAGYSLGGNVALHAAALDNRVAGVAAFAAFTPFRTDTNDRSTYCLRRLYDLHAIIPRLGLFANQTSTVPYDYDELIGSLAPRPVLLYTPQQDRDATYNDVKACVSNLEKQWTAAGAPNNLTVIAPVKPTIMAHEESAQLVLWLKGL